MLVTMTPTASALVEISAMAEPYLARSVNQDSAKYRAILTTLRYMLDGGWLLLPGHGAIITRDQRL